MKSHAKEFYYLSIAMFNVQMVYFLFNQILMGTVYVEPAGYHKHTKMY
jgi:hypothetical protein